MKRREVKDLKKERNKKPLKCLNCVDDNTLRCIYGCRKYKGWHG